MRSVRTSHACNFQDMWKWKSARPTHSWKAGYAPVSLDSLPLLSDCITVSKHSPLQTAEVNFLYSTLYSCSTIWRRSKVCNQKEIVFTVLIRWTKVDLIAGEVASSQSLNLIIPRAPYAFRVTWSERVLFDREGLGRRRTGTKQGSPYNWPNG